MSKYTLKLQDNFLGYQIGLEWKIKEFQNK